VAYLLFASGQELRLQSPETLFSLLQNVCAFVSILWAVRGG
jgi:hypothetical protein